MSGTATNDVACFRASRVNVIQKKPTKSARALTCISAVIFRHKYHIASTQHPTPSSLVGFGLQRRSSRLLRVLRVDRRLGTPRGLPPRGRPCLWQFSLCRAKGASMCSASLDSCSILICENGPLIALDIANAFTNAGARVVTVRSLAQAFTVVEDDAPSVVILHHALRAGESSQLCERLKEQKRSRTCSTEDTPTQEGRPIMS
jgi:hypothetical protein